MGHLETNSESRTAKGRWRRPVVLLRCGKVDLIRKDVECGVESLTPSEKGERELVFGFWGSRWFAGSV
jgi:hypothetical protein